MQDTAVCLTIASDIDLDSHKLIIYKHEETSGLMIRKLLTQQVQKICYAYLSKSKRLIKFRVFI